MAQRHVIGCLLGTAVGDALGLPYEGLTRQRAAKLLGEPDRYRFLGRRGMVSDDTEHTCMVAQALIVSRGEVDSFRRELARRLRGWLLCVPAGLGLATLQAILRLWLGISPERSGVFSAGNGPAMRAAILGATVDDMPSLRRLVQASARITHTDARAERGALAVALAARMARSPECISGALFLERLQSLLGSDDDELTTLIARAAASVREGQSTESFAASLGFDRGVSGYVNHTVPVAIHAWLAHPWDYGSAVSAVIRCGGDADSTGAIVGGIVGTAVGSEGIPNVWLEGLLEWPRSIAWIEQLGGQLAGVGQLDTVTLAPELPMWGVIPRNVLFLLVVLLHGIRRLLPPY